MAAILWYFLLQLLSRHLDIFFKSAITLYKEENLNKIFETVPQFSREDREDKKNCLREEN